MTKVTLLGDSIRLIGYGKSVSGLLCSDFEVYQPADNCRYSKYTLRGLYDWQEDMKGSTIVHWNNGLWDSCDLFGEGLFTPEEEYVKNMLRIADILIANYGRVIFATTTPVLSKNEFNKNEDIKRYNDIIVPLLIEKGVVINDLYSLVLQDTERYIRHDDCVHLSEEGIAVCSQRVAEVIKTVSQKECTDERYLGHEMKLKQIGLPV